MLLNQAKNIFSHVLLYCGVMIFFLASGCQSDQDEIPLHVEFREAVIDYQGHFILPPKYDNVDVYLNSDGHFNVSKKPPSSEDNGDNGYGLIIDQNGRVLENEYIGSGMDWRLSYSYTNDDHRLGSRKIVNNLPNLKAKLSKENNKYGFVNKEGKWVISPQWDLVEGFQSNPPTSFVWIYGHPFSRWGIIDQEGHYLLKPTCVALRSFDNTNRPIKICQIPFTIDGKQL